MSAKSAPNVVEAYFAKAPEFARPMCAKMVALIEKAGPELRAEIKWGCPVWSGRAMVCGLGVFKAHVNLHFFKGALIPDPDGLLTHGEGNASSRTIQFTAEDEVPVKALEKLLRAAVKADADPEVKAAPQAKRAERPLPDDLAKAVKANAKAQATWDTLPPSCRREYIEWVTTAKREETRTRRLEEMVTMLQAGRRRNDQYR